MTSMVAVLACAFPLLITVAVLAALPMRLPGDRPNRPRDTRPLERSQHFKHVLAYIPLVAACAYVLQFLQQRLFMLAASDRAPFMYRQTDISALSFLTAFFVAIVVAAPIGYRLMLRFYGPEYVLSIADRPDRSRMPMSLRQTIGSMWPMALGVAVLMVILNGASFDTFMRVADGHVHYSFFSSPRSQHEPIDSIDELRLYSRRRAPNGNIVRRRTLEIRFIDGRALDTFYLIEDNQLERLTAAITGDPAFRGRVTESRDVLEP